MDALAKRRTSRIAVIMLMRRVREMGMRVAQLHVPMPMGIGCARYHRQIVSMLMFVVLMLQLGLHVRVLMAFGEMQPESRSVSRANSRHVEGGVSTMSFEP